MTATAHARLERQGPVAVLRDARRLIERDGYNPQPQPRRTGARSLCSAVMDAAGADPSWTDVNAQLRYELALAFVCDTLGVGFKPGHAGDVVTNASLHPTVAGDPLGPLWALGVLQQAERRAAAVVKVRDEHSPAREWSWLH